MARGLCAFRCEGDEREHWQTVRRTPRSLRVDPRLSRQSNLSAHLTLVLGVTYYGDKGTLKLSVWSYDYIPKGKDGGSPVKVKAVEEREKYPEDVQHKRRSSSLCPATAPTS